jgi:hypothetical protein
MNPADHQKLTDCWRAALDLVIHGYPHSTDGSSEFWHRAAGMVIHDLKEILTKYDPHQTPSATLNDHSDRGAN